MATNGAYEYTSSVQLKILTLLWRDQQSHNLYRDAIKPKYFSQAINIDLCRIIFDYYDKYGISPTTEVLLEEVNKLCESSKSKQHLKEEYLSTIDQMSKVELHDQEYIKNKIVTFGKRQALKDAIMASAEIIEKQPDTKYNQIEQLVRTALTVGDDVGQLGTDLFDDIEGRFYGYEKERDVIERIPSGMQLLDLSLKGGLGRTEMGVVVAAPGLGKSTTLISIGAAAVDSGYKVLHISLENNEKQVVRNYDMRLLGHDMEYIKGNVKGCIDSMRVRRDNKTGRLKVKKYPTKTITVLTLRRLLDQLKVVEDFQPDVLIIDYGTLVKPTSNYADKRNNIESVYEEIRALADDYNCAIWTAAQGNRGALSKRVVTMADLAECFAIANIADVMVCLCQTKIEKSKGIMRLFLAKIRDSADNKVLRGTIDYSIKKVNFVEEVDLAEQLEGEEEEEDSWE